MKCGNNFQLEIIVWKIKFQKNRLSSQKVRGEGRGHGRNSENQISFCMQNGGIYIAYLLSNINCARKSFAVQLRIIIEDPYT
jgi:hypothetical protein